MMNITDLANSSLAAFQVGCPQTGEHLQLRVQRMASIHITYPHSIQESR